MLLLPGSSGVVAQPKNRADDAHDDLDGRLKWASWSQQTRTSAADAHDARAGLGLGGVPQPWQAADAHAAGGVVVWSVAQPGHQLARWMLAMLGLGGEVAQPRQEAAPLMLAMLGLCGVTQP